MKKKPETDWEISERDKKYPVEITQRTEREAKDGIDGKRKKLRVSTV
jgi:hypothetical protein